MIRTRPVDFCTIKDWRIGGHLLSVPASNRRGKVAGSARTQAIQRMSG